ncbi:hypothetical protein KZX37_01930 [Microbacterium sp. EYE_5]|uniref:hypothetical protein n=1 Tax=unclassified Microbacterium TaxID=2609290 RepID=UPI002002E8A3|nr:MULTISPECIES: hypothetical protein [unclassified Microbacterium]MCK6079378.1 hypothetical protein [Microbacterium sp. EYE_382]MCK6084648.1 hypothetical protein [Microbacterium sp. EYE_384]MCK6123123.1 hypothetical protein [Microbacterium sp. EYE_80]MCK6125412.1 hypothetical protein [Microbacterium sp. EYE_79]MCK6140332.1 hypothetical protein [Microbacterium sp. EYE_39]
MTKQLVNLIGAAAAVAVLVLGIVVCALPLLSAAGTTASAADDVAQQNRTQEILLDTLRSQSADMAALDADVEDLRAAIPAAPHLDDVLYLALSAAEAHGGRVTALTPATAEPFAIRSEEEATAPGGAASAADAPAEAGGADPGEQTAAETPKATAAGAPSEPSAPIQIAVTVVIEAADVDAATRVLDALRAGPRAVAVTQASVTQATEDGVTLTATVLAFSSP